MSKDFAYWVRFCSVMGRKLFIKNKTVIIFLVFAFLIMTTFTCIYKKPPHFINQEYGYEITAPPQLWSTSRMVLFRKSKAAMSRGKSERISLSAASRLRNNITRLSGRSLVILLILATCRSSMSRKRMIMSLYLP